MSYGRRVIYTNAQSITSDNVAEEVRAAVKTHKANSTEIDTLYRYYRGCTQIQKKQKEVREDINHKICENRAYEIVSFHKGYTFGEPIQYIRREKSDEKGDDEKIAAGINKLNAYMNQADKPACDNELAEWMLVAGTAYRLILPNDNWNKDADEPPFYLYTLDPRTTFVVYSSSITHKPMMAVHMVQKEAHKITYCVYTENAYYEFDEFGTTPPEAKPHILAQIPIIEYPADQSRLGVFEIVQSMLDALDELQSNRMDDIVQFVNSFLAILGGQLDEETYKKLNEWKTLCLPTGVDAKYLSPAMNQGDVQRFKEDLYESILTICGVPNHKGNASGGDNGCAIQLRDGWQLAEARAKATELVFKRSERNLQKLVLRIMRDTVGTELKLSDIETHFTRRNYENIAAKCQVLTAMLSCPKIAPELAFAHCGMFADPESAYLQSKEWWEENEKKEEAKLVHTESSAVPPVQPAAHGPKRPSTNKVS